MKLWIAILAAGAMAILAIGVGAEPTQALSTFTDITKQAGITFKHSYGDHHLDNIVEGTGGGVCVFDYNGDGLMDLYFVTGTWTSDVSSNEGRDLRGKLSNKLYRNNGDARSPTCPNRPESAATACSLRLFGRRLRQRRPRGFVRP